MGPQGTGGLAVAEGIDVAPWAMGGTGVHSFDALQPREWPTRLEAGTLNGHGIAGLSAGLDFIEAQGGVEAIASHERALADRFLAGVREIPGIKLYGAFDLPTRSAIVSLNVGDIDSARFRMRSCKGGGLRRAPVLTALRSCTARWGPSARVSFASRLGISTRTRKLTPRLKLCAI